VATSIGWASRCIGASLPNFATSLGLKLDVMSGVHTGPGAIPFTRIPFLTRLVERLRVKLTIAPFVDA